MVLAFADFRGIAQFGQIAAIVERPEDATISGGDAVDALRIG